MGDSSTLVPSITLPTFGDGGFGAHASAPGVGGWIALRAAPGEPQAEPVAMFATVKLPERPRLTTGWPVAFTTVANATPGVAARPLARSAPTSITMRPPTPGAPFVPFVAGKVTVSVNGVVKVGP